MATKVRQMIKIDEEKCNGCGLCVPACAEGAIQIVDGKAKVVMEKYCDGLGACLGECPQGAISFETREADDFDEAATIQHLKETGRSVEAHLAHMAEHAAGGHADHAGHAHHAHAGFVCPSARTIDRTRECTHEDVPSAGSVQSELRQWPVKLHLVSPAASFFQDADLLIVADCVPFAYGSLHPDFLRGKVVVAGCPKFDDIEAHVAKLTEIFARNDVRRVTVLQMEVPCCSGLGRAAEAAVSASGKDVPLDTVTISLSGEVAQKRAACV
jgi:Pyruvate/2-oxoacid:ferredoxin oxidoreductase delta subunit